MRSLILIGAAGLVAGSPAPAITGINLAMVTAAAEPAAVGPSLGVSNQTSVYNAVSASSAAVAAVSGVATASATASVTGVNKRGLEERTICILGFCFGGTSPASTSSAKAAASTSCTTSATTVKATATPATTLATSTTAPAPVTTAYTPYYHDVPSTCTPVSWTNTFAFTSATACPSPFEVGTYCGFKNPEDPCAPQPDGYAPTTTPDTDVAFLANPIYHKMAKDAPTPKGYNRTFVDVNASVNANSYMGVYTMQSYDVQACADKCDNTELCTAFNFYVERGPMWNPDKCSCTGLDTASIAGFKCTLWGSGVEPAAATNDGQWASGFHVVNTASNGYEKTNITAPATPSGWNNPQKCSGVHHHPSTCIGEKLFKGVFDVSICATYAAQQNAVNVKSGIISKILSLIGYNSGKCNFFNAFMLTQDGKAQGTYCKLFAQTYSPSVGNVIPGWSQGHYYGVESSWSFCAA